MTAGFDVFDDFDRRFLFLTAGFDVFDDFDRRFLFLKDVF